MRGRKWVSEGVIRRVAPEIITLRLGRHAFEGLPGRPLKSRAHNGYVYEAVQVGAYDFVDDTYLVTYKRGDKLGVN